MIDIRTYIICESIDSDNLFWKIDKWFDKSNIDNSEKQAFIDLLDICRNNNNIVTKDVVSNYALSNNIKPFVNFITDNVSGIEVNDYIYILMKIIQLILANKSYVLQ